MDTQYLDFELELGAGNSGSGWPLSVIQSPAGQARGVLTLPDAPEQIALQAHRSSPQEAQNLGKMLFERLLLSSGVYGPYTEGLGAADAKEKAMRVKLRIIDPQLALVPWELMYEDRFGEYVALSDETPVVRYAEAAQPQMPLAVKPPLRILGTAISPTDLEPIDIGAQKQAVEAALAGLVARGLVELVWLKGGTWRDLQQTLRGGGPWHMLHFVGHGTVNRATGEGALAFAADDGTAHLLGASELGRILATHKYLRLVLLNACRSATPSAGNLYTSAAATLIRRGLPAVIAMQFAISHSAAVELARTFYESLADGLPVEGALTHARIAVSVAQSDTLDWAAPVLYLRAPDGVLFEVERKAAKPASAGEALGQEDRSSGNSKPVDVERLIVPNVRELKGMQLQAAMKAISSAYGTKPELRRMVSFHLNENLDAIVGDSGLDNMVFELLEWARMRGRLTELLQGAVDGNPTNPDLREFIKIL